MLAESIPGHLKGSQIRALEGPWKAWDDVSSVVSVNHEANIRGGGKTVHVVFKYLFRSML
jgi:hypothetical protein